MTKQSICIEREIRIQRATEALAPYVDHRAVPCEYTWAEDTVRQALATHLADLTRPLVSCLLNSLQRRVGSLIECPDWDTEDLAPRTVRELATYVCAVYHGWANCGYCGGHGMVAGTPQAPDGHTWLSKDCPDCLGRGIVLDRCIDCEAIAEHVGTARCNACARKVVSL